MKTKTWDDVLSALDGVLTGTFESTEEMATALATVREQLAAMIAEAQAGTTEEMAAASEAVAKAFGKIDKIETAIKARQMMDDAKSRLRVDNREKFTSQPSGMDAKTGTVDMRVKTRPYRGKGFKQFGTDAAFAAHKAGAQIAALLGDDKAAQFCKDHGINFRVKLQSEGNDALGGLIVTDELDTAIRYYREERGVARNIMTVRSGSTETYRFSRNTGGTAVKALGEGQTYSQSDIKFDQVVTTAKKFGAMTSATMEVTEDAYANLAEEIARDHGYAHAVFEDRAAFLGDGSSTYNGIVGLTEQFKSLVTNAGGTWTTDANKAYAGSVFVSTGSTIAALTLADIYKAQSKVATFPGLVNRLYIPSQIWYGQVVPLMNAAGGNTTAQIVDGVQRQFLNGMEVVFIDELYTPLLTAENNQFLAFVGSASEAGLMYDRMGLSVTPSSEAGYLSDTLYWKSTARYGFNWWNIGNASATASQRVRGALAAIVTKN
jgi:HK97 family phage major capsid protein